MMDPRPAGASRRLAGARRIVAFSSAKGGVGKSFCAVASAVALASTGRRVGLLDLDLQGASTHLFLGARLGLPLENNGILPLEVIPNLLTMSAALFTGERALALRGPEVSHAILEMLCVTQWGDLDALLIDMPPGIGEEILDLVRLIPRLEAMIVSTPSRVSVIVAERLVVLLEEARVRILGVVANMYRGGCPAPGDDGAVGEMARKHGLRLLGRVPFDEGVEGALGNPPALAGGKAGAAIKSILAEIGLL